MDFANDEVERVRRAHQVIMAKDPVFKTFHVIGMIFWDDNLNLLSFTFITGKLRKNLCFTL